MISKDVTKDIKDQGTKEAVTKHIAIVESQLKEQVKQELVDFEVAYK